MYDYLVELGVICGVGSLVFDIWHCIFNFVND